MSAKRVFYVMLGLVVLISLLVAASVFGANAFLNSQKDKLVKAKVDNQVVEQQQQYLVRAKEDLKKYDELNATTKAIVPQDKDQAKTVREISTVAQKSGIQLDSITFPISSLGGISVAPPSSSDSSSSGAAPADGAQAAPPSGLTQVAPVEGISGVYSLEIIVSSQSPVPYYQFLDFLERLESNRRTAHVQKLVLNPTESGDALSFILTLNAYVKP
jgi:hypothetical protein